MKNLDSYAAIYGALEETHWNTEIHASRDREKISPELVVPASALHGLLTRDQVAVLQIWFPKTARTLLGVIARSKE